MPLRWVLEFGAGHHSTPFFLSLDLDHLTSVEDDPEWAEHVECDDPRHELRDSAPESLDAYDLIFVDNGRCAADRVPVIRRVLSEAGCIVVIHDAEVSEYAFEIAEHAPEPYASFGPAPLTAVCGPVDLAAIAERIT